MFHFYHRCSRDSSHPSIHNHDWCCKEANKSITFDNNQEYHGVTQIQPSLFDVILQTNHAHSFSNTFQHIDEILVQIKIIWQEMNNVEYFTLHTSLFWCAINIILFHFDDYCTRLIRYKWKYEVRFRLKMMQNSIR